MSKRLAELKPGRFLLCEAFDNQSLHGMDQNTPRANPMPASLVVFDDLGAGEGQIIALSEGREATMPWWPDRMPIDAYCAAILDQVDMT